jgi:hypothetical protein
MSSEEVIEYLDKMAKQGTWGDGIMLSVAVKLYRRPIEILSAEGHLSHIDMAEPSSDVEPIWLGLADEHYVSLRKAVINQSVICKIPSTLTTNENQEQDKIVQVSEII